MNFSIDFIPADKQAAAMSRALIKANAIAKAQNENAKERESTITYYWPSKADFEADCPTAPAERQLPVKKTFGFIGAESAGRKLCTVVSQSTVSATNKNGTPDEAFDWSTLDVEDKAKAKAGSTVIILSETAAGISEDIEGGIWVRPEPKRQVTARHFDDWTAQPETRLAKLAFTTTSIDARVAVQTLENKLIAVQNDAKVAFAKALVAIGVSADKAAEMISQTVEVA